MMTLTQRKEIRLCVTERLHEHEQLHHHGAVLPGASQIRAAKQRKVDRTGGTLARLVPRSRFLALSEVAAAAVNAY